MRLHALNQCVASPKIPEDMKIFPPLPSSVLSLFSVYCICISASHCTAVHAYVWTRQALHFLRYGLKCPYTIRQSYSAEKSSPVSTHTTGRQLQPPVQSLLRNRSHLYFNSALPLLRKEREPRGDVII